MDYDVLSDSGGNDCDWYSGRTWQCGNYDVGAMGVYTFEADRDCCACGGGYSAIDAASDLLETYCDADEENCTELTPTHLIIAAVAVVLLLLLAGIVYHCCCRPLFCFSCCCAGKGESTAAVVSKEGGSATGEDDEKAVKVEMAAVEPEV